MDWRDAVTVALAGVLGMASGVFGPAGVAAGVVAGAAAGARWGAGRTASPRSNGASRTTTPARDARRFIRRAA